MKSGRPTILAVKATPWAPLPEEVVCIETSGDEPPEREMAALRWDYIHLGIGCRVLDGRIFEIAGEYASTEKPDLIVLSAPGERLVTGSYGERAHIYEIICHMARRGTLYCFGNKLFSRELWFAMGGGTETARLTRAFLQMERMLLLSHPWVETGKNAAPTDEEFLALVERYAARGESS